MTEEEKLSAQEAFPGSDIIFGTRNFAVETTENYRNATVIHRGIDVQVDWFRKGSPYDDVRIPIETDDVLVTTGADNLYFVVNTMVLRYPQTKVYSFFCPRYGGQPCTMRSYPALKMSKVDWEDFSKKDKSYYYKYLDSSFKSYEDLPFQASKRKKDPLEIKMGFEWEVPIKDLTGEDEVERKKRLVIDKLKEAGLGEWFIIKSDGSLNCGDPEIVSTPMYLHQFRELVPKLSVLTPIIRKGDEKEYGLHIHCDKKVLTHLHWQVARDLLNKNQKHWETFGGRKSNTWCQYTNSDEKYTALNLTPDNTSEFRLFKSPKDPLSILETMEVVQGFINKIASIEINVDKKLFMGDVKCFSSIQRPTGSSTVPQDYGVSPTRISRQE